MDCPRRFFSPLALLVALAVGAAAYYPGLGGTLHFDDTVNLRGLATITDFATAFRFVMEGIGGPLGRPLALASFVPQAYAWSATPDVFLYTNICLHLLNGVLVIWVLYLLTLAWRGERHQAEWVAVVSGGVWMLMPLLASSSLLIVQRMTTLSATFLFLGFIGYLYSRALVYKRPRSALLLMSTSLVLGSMLAVIAKENGALLPLFVLVAETTLLPPPQDAKLRALWKRWSNVFLVLPAVALLVYLGLHWQYSDNVLLRRGFSGPDRLLTEAHVLWKYLYHAFLPATSNLGPFHDDQFIARDWLQPTSLLAVGGWLAVIGLAAAYRRRAPVFSFAAGWYLVGHALESTTLPLELYFEHRNYVPLVGPAFALVASILTANLRTSKSIVRLGLCAYALLLSVVLFNTTALWGQPALAAEVWAIQHPQSTRANQYLAQQIEKTGDLRTVRKVLRSFLEKDPTNAAVTLQVLALSCALEPDEDHQRLVEAAGENLARPRFDAGSFDGLKLLHRVAKENTCEAVERETVYGLATIAAGNPAFKATRVEHHNLHVLMAEEAFAQRNLDLMMRHIESALASHYSMSTLSLAVRMLNSAGLYATANAFLDEAARHAPMHPIRASMWQREIETLRQDTDAAAENAPIPDDSESDATEVSIAGQKLRTTDDG